MMNKTYDDVDPDRRGSFLTHIHSLVPGMKTSEAIPVTPFNKRVQKMCTVPMKQ
jgi:hypothetical protein